LKSKSTKLLEEGMGSKTHLNQAIAAHLVEIKADETPDREIFVFERGDHGDDVLTYKDLYENSNKIARLLLDHGIGKGDVFAVFMRNYPEFAYCLLAGGFTGAVMVPVDPRSRGDRLSFLLANSNTKAVIASSECLEQIAEVINDLPNVKFVTVAYQRDQQVPLSPNFHALNETLEANSWRTVDQQIMDVRHPMQIIYTSGTTGTPKGVMIRNNRLGVFNIMTKLCWKYSKTDCLYTGLSLTHGNAQAVTFFPALNMGIKAVFSPRFTKSRIWDICRKYGCTTFSLLGGMMAGIYNEPQRQDDSDNPVKIVLSAGTSRSIWEAFEKRFGVKILEWYGAVEGGFAFKPPGQGPVGSFGKPIPGIMEFKVVDENDNEVPVGKTGELISRMVHGETRVDYLDLPDASQEKTRGGWLRSGDMVHRDEKGWFFFDYRKGSELRRAGDFVQPDYVEAAIGKHPDVGEVCVYGIPAASGAPGESDLVAALAPLEGTSIDPKSVFELCEKELERNYIPSYLQIVNEIPKSISEKALDRALKQDFSPDASNVFSYNDYS
jgi:crotonobetaine/carnitine-CoA ligase